VSTENATNAPYPINIGKKRSDFDAFALGVPPRANASKSAKE
jgi:hypothetical protein